MGNQEREGQNTKSNLNAGDLPNDKAGIKEIKHGKQTNYKINTKIYICTTEFINIQTYMNITRNLQKQ